MAHSNSFNTPSSSHSIASPAASNHSGHSGSGSSTTASFSIFQEGPGHVLVFAPPRGTPELQALVDLFINLDVPVDMKMDIIQRDFEAHAARTNERYKTYFVPGAATPRPASVSPVAAAAVTTPNELTASPTSLFSNTFDLGFSGQQTPAPGSASASASASGSGSSSGSVYFDGSPATRSSPTGSDPLAGSDALVPYDMPLFPSFTSLIADQSLDLTAYMNNANFLPMSTMADQNQQMAMMNSLTTGATSTWPTTLTTAASPSDVLATPSSQLVQRTLQQRRSQDRQHRPSSQSQRRQITGGGSSMQIITRNGEDVTHMSSRATRTHEERENTRLVRQRGACADCRRKKTRCDPAHLGSSLDRMASRAAPYTSPVMAGRAMQEAAAAQAAKAAKEKKAGKQAVTTSDPVFTAPASIDSSILSGVERGGGLQHSGDFGLDMSSNPIDWYSFSAQDLLFNSDDLDLDIAATLSMTTPSTTTATATATATVNANATQNGAGLAHMDEYGVLPRRPIDPPRPANTQPHANLTTTDRSSLLSHMETPSISERGGTSASSLPVHSTHRPQANAGDLVTGERDFCGFSNSEPAVADDDFSWATDSSPTSNEASAASLLSDSSSHSEPEIEPGHEPGGGDSPVPDVDEGHHSSKNETEKRRTGPTRTRRRNGPIAESDSESQTQTQSQLQPQPQLQTHQQPYGVSTQGTASLSDETLALLAGLAGLAHTLIPAYLAWTAAQSSDDLDTELGERMDRLNVGSAMISCQ